MGAKITVSVINQTPYAWHFATQNKSGILIHAGGVVSYNEDYYSNCNISFRYENKTTDSFRYEFDTNERVYWWELTFILRETSDGSQIELRCTNDGGTRYCPNYRNTED